MMKILSEKSSDALLTLVLMSAVPVFLHSCNLFSDVSRGEGMLRVTFAEDQEILTRSGIDIPDTSDFILTVTDSGGAVVYDGPFGASPESMPLEAGSYNVSIISQEFPKPAFSMPQFGDEQCVVVTSGSVVDVKLICRQINSGIRLKIDPDFIDKYPDGSFLLRSTFGKLLYRYSEKRIAYFTPGNVSLVLANEGTDKVLVTKTLEPQEVLELKVSVSGSAGSDIASNGISVALDTTRSWTWDEYVLGGSGGSGGAVSVSEALSMAGEDDVQVCGYIVGGDLTSTSASFSKPFSSRTNIVLGPRSSTSDKESCMSVQLPAGELRDDLNLVDNPHLLGRKICLKGNIVEAYYGIPGMKNVSEYELQ